ncbi:unnamed protein product [Notodromas monacha]|uniref:Uncharacterized protein n=1 Tax=Notodromas monacha TaxID=399045 RepID=A0A7R9BRD2_9CRUS|nr:unnamed protein product [Notodromas monacha]CAG0919361.1 unnamed protein product [Notodromas monacha]
MQKHLSNKADTFLCAKESRLIEGCEVVVESVDAPHVSEDQLAVSNSPKTSKQTGTMSSDAASSMSTSSAAQNLAKNEQKSSSSSSNVQSGAPQKFYCYSMPTTGHNDGITDVVVVNTPQTMNLIATASRDGVIKLWK